jgi:hypothetical protein
MLECKEGSVLCLEYEPGMFRKVTVKSIFEGFTRKGGRGPHISLCGMKTYFLQKDGSEIRFGGSFMRKLVPFNQSLIDKTQAEREQRKLVKWFEE